MNVKIITVSSKRHFKFKDALCEEIHKHCNDQCLVAYELDDSCEGNWGTDNFYNACFKKLEAIIKELEALNDGDVLIYLDSDIAVFGDITTAMISELQDHDIAFQRDNKDLCAGMFVCRVSSRTLNFFRDVDYELKLNKKRYESIAHDQTVINETLPTSGLKYKCLSDRFTTYGNNNSGLWWPSSPGFELKEDVVAFHANWTIGVDNKSILLSHVRERMKIKKGTLI